MIFYNYDNDEVLILDQQTAELYQKGKLLKHETIILSTICLCRWMKDVS